MVDYSEYTVCVLDRFRVEKTGKPIEWLDYRKHEEFLAYATLNARVPIPRDEAAAILWPEISRAAGSNRLYETALKVRRQLARAGMDDDVIRVERGHVFVNPLLNRDVDRFDKLCALAVEDPRAGGTAVLEDLRELYGGGVLPGLRTEWVRGERARYRSTYEHAIGTILARQASPPSIHPGVDTRPALPGNGSRATHSNLMELANSLRKNLHTADHEFWLQMIDVNVSEIRHGFTRAVEVGDASRAIDLAGRFWQYWYHRGMHSEGQHYCDRALAMDRSHADRVSAALALNGSAMYATRLGDLEVAESHMDEAMRLWVLIDDQEQLANALFNQSMIEHAKGDDDRALALSYESLAIQRLAGNAALVTKRILDTAVAERRVGGFDRASSLLEEATERLGDSSGLLKAKLYESEAVLMMHQRGSGETVQEGDERLRLERGAEKRMAKAVGLYRGLKVREHLAFSLRCLAILAHWQGRHGEAESAYLEAEEEAVAAGNLLHAGNIIRDRADLLADAGRWEEAELLAQKSLSLLRSVRDSVGEREARELLVRIKTKAETPN